MYSLKTIQTFLKTVPYILSICQKSESEGSVIILTRVTQLRTLLKFEWRLKLSALLIQNLDVKFGLPLEGKTMTMFEEKSERKLSTYTETCTMGSFIVCAFHLLLLSCQNIGLSTLYSVSKLHLLVPDLFHILVIRIHGMHVMMSNHPTLNTRKRARNSMYTLMYLLYLHHLSIEIK
jgi:hypothetical protein